MSASWQEKNLTKKIIHYVFLFSILMRREGGRGRRERMREEEKKKKHDSGRMSPAKSFRKRAHVIISKIVNVLLRYKLTFKFCRKVDFMCVLYKIFAQFQAISKKNHKIYILIPIYNLRNAFFFFITLVLLDFPFFFLIFFLTPFPLLCSSASKFFDLACNLVINCARE